MPQREVNLRIQTTTVLKMDRDKSLKLSGYGSIRRVNPRDGRLFRQMLLDGFSKTPGD